jgi:predicted alpha-1,2-mannosidase
MSFLKNPRPSRRDVLKAVSALGVASTLPLALAKPAKSGAHTPSGDPLRWVNQRIGTGGHGHTYPGATVPFGMVQLSPDTTRTADGWDWCSGYHLSKKTILGFSHTHLSGTGCGDLLDFLVVPRTGALKLTPGEPGTGYGQHFSHANERMRPGYYAVKLDDSGIEAELTATERVGLHRYSFPASDESYILLDFGHSYYWDVKKPSSVIWSEASQTGDRMIVAGHATNAWGNGRQMFAAFEFSRPFDRIEFYRDGKPVTDAATRTKGSHLQAVVWFKTKAEEKILLRVGLSGVSTEGARKNLAAELPHWEFDKVSAAAAALWRAQLGKIRVETADEKLKTTFYSALYHTMLAPTLFDDVDGSYWGMDGKAHTLLPGRHNYTTYSLWDTFRAEHPLLLLLHPDRSPDIIESLVRMAVESPAGPPVWPLQGKETACMTGYHSAAVIAEACIKGVKGVDYPTALIALKKRAFVDDYRGLGYYRSLGFIPADLEEESVSKTLEYCYDDWAIAHLAARLGEKETAEKLLARSQNYRNYWDASTGFYRPKLKDGSWTTPFDPIAMGHSKKWRDYTESNAWQTTFGVQHDVAGAIALMGGDAAFIKHLDALFEQPSDLGADAPPDISGLIGQYAHGNEPSHHIAYLYAYAGAPEKTQKWVRQINTTMYADDPETGIAGNEDCGQMSAWFVLSSIGLYTVDPVGGQYVFGAPMFDRVECTLASGKKLLVETHRASQKSAYIRSVALNGKAHSRSWIGHEELVAGARLSFSLASEPSATFGKKPEDRPRSKQSINA